MFSPPLQLKRGALKRFQLTAGSGSPRVLKLSQLISNYRRKLRRDTSLAGPALLEGQAFFALFAIPPAAIRRRDAFRISQLEGDSYGNNDRKSPDIYRRDDVSASGLRSGFSLWMPMTDN